MIWWFGGILLKTWLNNGYLSILCWHLNNIFWKYFYLKKIKAWEVIRPNFAPGNTTKEWSQKIHEKSRKQNKIYKKTKDAIAQSLQNYVLWFSLHNFLCILCIWKNPNTCETFLSISPSLHEFQPLFELDWRKFSSTKGGYS